jgi:C-terminal processing protease CtpA/Prc
MLRVLSFLALFPLVSQAQSEPREWFFAQPFLPHQGRIGVQVQPMTAELREYFRVARDRGVLVNHVEKDRPADRAGVRVGDVIVEAADRPVRDPSDLVRQTARVAAGEELRLRVVRDGKEESIVVRPEGEASPWIDPEFWREWLERGMSEGSRELRKQLEELQHRLEELERKFDEERKRHEGHMDRT